MSRAAILDAFGAVALRAPRLAARATELIARSSRRWGRARLDPEEIRRLMPELAPDEAEAAARTAWLNHVRLQVLHGARRRGREDFLHPRLIDDGGLSRLQGPAVLATAHSGPWYLIGEAARRVPGQLAVLRSDGSETDTPDKTSHATVGDGAGMRALYAGVTGLRAGGKVLIAVDGRPRRLTVPWFDRTLHVAQGPFTLSRLGRAPIVPFMLRWEGERGRIVLGEPIGPIADEQAAAEAFAAWLADYYRLYPGELGTHLVSTWISPTSLRPGAPEAARDEPSRSP